MSIPSLEIAKRLLGPGGFMVTMQDAKENSRDADTCRVRSEDKKNALITRANDACRAKNYHERAANNFAALYFHEKGSAEHSAEYEDELCAEYREERARRIRTRDKQNVERKT